MLTCLREDKAMSDPRVPVVFHRVAKAMAQAKDSAEARGSPIPHMLAKGSPIPHMSARVMKESMDLTLTKEPAVAVAEPKDSAVLHMLEAVPAGCHNQQGWCPQVYNQQEWHLQVYTS